jgi:hypothetical protein
MNSPQDPKVFKNEDKFAASQQISALEAESSDKAGGNKLEGSLNVARGAIRAPSPDPSLLSIDDSNNIRFGRNPDYLPDQNGRRHASRSPAPLQTTKGRLRAIWTKNMGLFLVLISQFFGALMNVTTRLLEMEGNNGKMVRSCSHETTKKDVQAKDIILFTFFLLVWVSRSCVHRYTCGTRRRSIFLLA